MKIVSGSESWNDDQQLSSPCSREEKANYSVDSAIKRADVGACQPQPIST